MSLRAIFRSRRPFSVNIIGKRACGKTTLTFRLIRYFQEMSPRGHVLVFSPYDSNELRHYKFKQYPNLHYLNYSDMPSIMTQIMESQKQQMVSQHMQQRSRLRQFLVACIDFSAVSTDQSLRRTIETMCTNGRHCNISLIFETQYAKGLKPSIRSQMDYVCLFKQVQPIEAFNAYLNGHFTSPQSFANTMNRLRGYQSLVVDLTRPDLNANYFIDKGGMERIHWQKAICVAIMVRHLRRVLIDDLIFTVTKYV